MCSQNGEVERVSPRVQELLNHVARTPIRIEILSILADEALDLRDLSDRLDSPRTTLRHNLQEMIEVNLIEETIENEFRSTPLGEIILDALTAFSDRVETALKLEPLFSCVSPSEFDFDIGNLSAVTVTESTRTKPYAPQHRLTALIQDARNVSGYIPTSPFLFNQTDVPIFQTTDSDISLYVPEEIADTLQAEHEAELKTLLQRGPLDIGVLSGANIDYGVARIDDRAVILGLDEHDKPHVLVEATDETVQEWASKRIDGLRTEACSIMGADNQGKHRSLTSKTD